MFNVVVDNSTEEPDNKADNVVEDLAEGLKYETLKVTPKDVIRLQQLLFRYPNRQDYIAFIAEEAVIDYCIDILVRSGATFNNTAVTKVLFDENMDAAVALFGIIGNIVEEIAKLIVKKKK